MFNLVYKDKKIKCPSLPYEISLEKGMAIQYIRNECHDDIDIAAKRNIISLLTNLNITILNLWDDDTIENIYSKIKLFDEQALPSYKVFKLNKTKYGLIDFDTMTVGEYEEMVFYLNQGETSVDFIDKLCCLLYRPLSELYTSKRNILYNMLLKLRFKNIIPLTYQSYKVINYTNDYDKNIQLFREKLDYRFALITFGLINEFIEKLANEFKNIFKNEDVDKEDEDYQEEVKKNIDSISARWGFYHILSVVCNDDLKMIEYWRTKPIKQFFVHLTYLNQKAYDEYLRSQNK